jgi:hypothetical protein
MPLTRSAGRPRRTAAAVKAKRRRRSVWPSGPARVPVMPAGSRLRVSRCGWPNAHFAPLSSLSSSFRLLWASHSPSRISVSSAMGRQPCSGGVWTSARCQKLRASSTIATEAISQLSREALSGVKTASTVTFEASGAAS